MAIVSGTTATRGTASTNPAIQIIPNVADRIFMTGAAELAFLRLIPRLKKEKTTDMEYTILTDARIAYTVTTNAGTLTAGTTTLTMDDTAAIRPWDVIKNERTKEQVYVSAVPTSTTLTVVRGYGPTAAAAFLDNDVWRKIGVAMSDGSLAPESRQTTVGSLVNYLQWFAAVVDLTEQQEATSLYGMDEHKRQTKGTMFDFRRSIANAFYFGEPKKDVDNASPTDSALVNSRYVTGGLEYFINNDGDSANIILDAGGILTEDLLWDLVKSVNKNDPEHKGDGELGKVLLSSDKLVKVINKWKLPTVQTTVAEQTFGGNVTTYQSPFGRLNVVYDLLLDGAEYGDYGFLVNPNYLTYKFLQGKDMRVKPNIQPNDSHTRKDEIYGAIGLGFSGPVSAHGMIKNATNAG